MFKSIKQSENMQKSMEESGESHGALGLSVYHLVGIIHVKLDTKLNVDRSIGLRKLCVQWFLQHKPCLQRWWWRRGDMASVTVVRLAPYTPLALEHTATVVAQGFMVSTTR
jgi:hypothetical protein